MKRKTASLLVTLAVLGAHTAWGSMTDAQAKALEKAACNHTESPAGAAALKKLEGAAEAGAPAAQYRLADFFTCDAAHFSVAKGTDWYRKAAIQGFVNAQFILGVAYYQGRGVPQDYAKARYWWTKAAAQGLAQAQFNLGIAYARGRGVAQDYVKATYRYRKAAAQGLAK
ncbi:MAG: tetratricopeptide repeat protein, partial [Gammaproteobacteria bacterium]